MPPYVQYSARMMTMKHYSKLLYPRASKSPTQSRQMDGYKSGVANFRCEQSLTAIETPKFSPWMSCVDDRFEVPRKPKGVVSLETLLLLVQLRLPHDLLPNHLLRILMNTILLPAEIRIRIRRRILDIKDIHLNLRKVTKEAHICQRQRATSPECTRDLLKVRMLRKQLHGLDKVRIMHVAALLAALEMWNCAWCCIVEAKPEIAQVGDVCCAYEVQEQA